MINYYNAFISYKHADLDNKVAAEIVKGLEHYHIPGKIRKQTGVKKIDRIFRDKDELPITNDLNDTIAEALKNADYLIVICSTNTKKSTWVEKEIETFLQNHTMGQVLTVLADGEPYDVIPKILLTSKKEIQDENGETHTIEVPLEPLSCDFRLPVKRARAEELPRLAAALIGCSYDELMNRHRQYKMRKLTAIFAGAMALMIGFTGYMLYSNSLIHKNYIESLRNKSKYLANESLKLLENENRIEAMQLALEALPKDEKDETPVTPEALKAITQSSLSYVSLAGSNIDAAWNYQMSNQVREYKVSNDGSKLAAEDQGNNVTVWDTTTHQVLLNCNVNQFDGLFFFDDNTLIVSSWDFIDAYDLKTGERKWRNEDLSTVTEDIFNYTDTTFLVPDSHGRISEVSVKDGSVVNTIDFNVIEEKYSMDSCDEFVLSPDKKRIAFCLGQGTSEEHTYLHKSYSLMEYDIQTGELLSYPLEDQKIHYIAYLNDKLYTACTNGTLDGSGKMYDNIYITDDHTGIYCFNSGELTLNWQYDFVSTNYAINCGFKVLNDTKMAFYAGNMVRAWDNETGELQLEDNVNEPIISVNETGKELSPMYITKSGSMATHTTMSETSSGLTLTSRFTDDLTDAIIKKGIYTHQAYSHTIVFYGVGISDEDWTKFDNCPVYENTFSCYNLDEKVLSIAVSDGADGSDILLFDSDQKTYKDSIHVSDSCRYSKVKLLGTCEGKFYYAFTEYDDKYNSILYLASFDLVTKEQTKEKLNDSYGPSNAQMVLSDNNLVYYNNIDYYNSVVVLNDLKSGEKTEVNLDDLEVQYCKTIKYFSKANLAYISCGSSDMPSYKIIDFNNNTSFDIAVPSGWEAPTDIAVDDTGKRVAITNGEVILLKDIEGELIQEISCNNASPMGMAFLDFENLGTLLVVPYSNGSMFRYSGDDGSFIGKSDLSTYYNNYGETATFEIDKENNLLYVLESNILNIFELENWVEVAYIEHCYGHHKGTDTFLTWAYSSSSSELEVGYFKHYTTQDLIAKTKDYLQGTEMSEAERSMYGLDG
ncbi:toll/interleukin-1 receptor domain-containing protein [Butyrivibrio sp. AE2015]|uniref:toll/interleukin-1 receptor domain-containing protein n=1 Tax=Butyrivibrio sp. AE2015 TaxID=1280663 RepID=UPI0003B357FC|nr:toll/interleukin-1 receptor domain-containing protein [Butyrivibrio sp. AE2015]